MTRTIPMATRTMVISPDAENNKTKEFESQQFESAVKSHFFMGARLRLAQPEETIRIHACGILGAAWG